MAKQLISHLRNGKGQNESRRIRGMRNRVFMMSYNPIMSKKMNRDD